jgi:phage protein D
LKTTKAARISEDTEIRLSLRDIFGIVFVVVTVTSLVVRYEIKIDGLGDEIDKLRTHSQQTTRSIEGNSEFIRSIQLDEIRTQKDIEYILKGETQCQIN